jgi:[ribosomal protein S5]-alanine N-acetyltransferase
MLKLRESKIEDALFLFEIKQDKEFQKYYPDFLISKNIEEEKKLIKNYIEGSKKNKEKQFIILKNEERVGSLEIYKINKKHKRGSIGYAVKKEFWGQKIATKACALGLEKIKTEFGLHTIEATTYTKNIASQKVLEKNGFNKVGLMKDYYFFKGKYLDRILYWKVLD